MKKKIRTYSFLALFAVCMTFPVLSTHQARAEVMVDGGGEGGGGGGGGGGGPPDSWQTIFPVRTH